MYALSRHVGGEDVFRRQSVKVLEVDAEHEASDDGDEQKHSSVHGTAGGATSRRVRRVDGSVGAGRTSELFIRHPLTQILPCTAPTTLVDV